MPRAIRSSSRAPGAQPEGRPAGVAARRSGGDHGAVRVGQVEPGVRHDLRRGAAPLRRVAVGYARQFLGQMDKPDVDSIEGLSPAISIDQKTTSRNPRSTVGTVTEIYDYLRLLWSRIGEPHCPICGRPIVGQSAEQIIDQAMELGEGTRFMVLAPVVAAARASTASCWKSCARRASRASRSTTGCGSSGVDRARQALQARHLGRRGSVGDASRPASVWPTRSRRRLAWPKGWLRLRLWGLPVRVRSRARHRRAGRAQDRRRSSPARFRRTDDLHLLRALRLPGHGPSLLELKPRIFSFNSPHGACGHCTGLGAQLEIDPELTVPDPPCRSPRGRSRRGRTACPTTTPITRRSPSAMASTWTRPGLISPEPDAGICFSYGTKDGERLMMTYRNRYGPHGALTRPASRGSLRTCSDATARASPKGPKRKSSSTCLSRTCPECGGARLRAESRAVLVETPIEDFATLSARRALRWLRDVELFRDRQTCRQADPEGDLRALAVPRERRHRLPLDGPRRRDAFRGGSPADQFGNADRLVLGRRPLHPGRALHRPSPARQHAAHRYPRNIYATSATA